MSKPKILTLDIETAPAIAYVWRAYDENVGVEQIIEPGRMICFGAKWLGEREVVLYSEWEHGTHAMLVALHGLLSEADAVVTYNGDKFDLPKINGEFALAGIDPPPPPTSIDVVKTVRKLGFFMNRLAFIGPLLKCGEKVKHEGFRLWAEVLAGSTRARTRMEKYCKQDVRLLEKVYRKILPYIKNHPHLGEVGANKCGACGSGQIQRRGYRRTKAFIIERLRCNHCGSWSDGKRRKAR